MKRELYSLMLLFMLEMEHAEVLFLTVVSSFSSSGKLKWLDFKSLFSFFCIFNTFVSTIISQFIAGAVSLPLKRETLVLDSIGGQ